MSTITMSPELAPPAGNRTALIDQINTLITNVNTQLSLNRPLTLVILTRTSSPATPQTLRFPGSTPHQSHRFSVYLLMLKIIHDLLVSNTTATKREIYYRRVAFFRTQETVDRAVDDIAATLGVRRRELGIVAATKGLVSGGEAALLLHDCYRAHCHIPTPVTEDEGLKASGQPWVLYIEKETIYHRLFCTPLRRAGILITGKGYADIATREIVATLAHQGKNVYALVDLDPHGLEIMLTVKDGSMALAHEGAALTVRRLVWLGIRWTDVQDARNGWIPMRNGDRQKARSMLEKTTGEIRSALQRLLWVGMKAEIEIIEERLEKWVTKRIEEEEKKEMLLKQWIPWEGDIWSADGVKEDMDDMLI